MEDYKVYYSPIAQEDLRSVASYIFYTLKEHHTAARLVRLLRSSITELQHLPLRCPIVDWEPWCSMQIRRLSVKNYVVFYQVHSETKSVVILRILYAKRNIDDILLN